MLCIPCLNIFNGSKPPIYQDLSTSVFRHHISPVHLARAAKRGCHICGSIWEKLSEDERNVLQNTWSDPFIYDLSQTVKRLLKKKPVDSYICSREKKPTGVYAIKFQFGDDPAWKTIVFDLLPVPANANSIEQQPLPKLDRLPRRADNLLNFSKVSQSHSTIKSNVISTVWTNEVKSMVQKWVHTCVSSHEACIVPHESSDFHPSRILDVSNNQIRLDIDPEHRPDHRWATLTHRWSSYPSKESQLTNDNLHSMCEEIDSQILTPTFREAIEVVRILGIRYLWIDSLCILQNGYGSEQDWQRESAVMGEIYQKAHLNIQAGHGEHDTSLGLFRTNGIRDVALCTVSYGRWNTTPVCIVDEDFARDELDKAPVNQRAWVLQERLLSHRILHFGPRQVFWQCRKGISCETFPEGLPDTIPKTIARATSENSPTTSQPMAIAQRLNGHIHPSSFQTINIPKDLRAWWYVVALYSSCSLTHQSDKLIAISGLAKIFSQTTSNAQDSDILPYLRNLTLSDSITALERQRSIIHPLGSPGIPIWSTSTGYLAGLWRQHLILSLLWHVSNGRQANDRRTQRIDDSSVAPSWSWASLNGLITPSVFERWPSIYGNYLSTIINAETQPIFPDNAWGAVAWGSILLSGRIINDSSFAWAEQSEQKVRANTSEIHISMTRKTKPNRASVARLRTWTCDVKCLIDDMLEFHSLRRSSSDDNYEIALLPLLELIPRRQKSSQDKTFECGMLEFHGLVVKSKMVGNQYSATRLGYFRVRDTDVFPWLMKKAKEREILLL